MLKNSYKIFVICKDLKTNEVTDVLKKEGHDIIFGSFREVFDEDGQTKGDIILIEMEKDAAKTLLFVKKIREKSIVPIMLLLGREQKTAGILGTDLGADDWLEEPFLPIEAASRIKALLRRCYEMAPKKKKKRGTSQPYEEDVSLSYEGLTLSQSLLCAYEGEEMIQLTGSEFRILAHMMRAPGKVFLKRELVSVLSPGGDGNENALMVHISHLRTKLKDDREPRKYIFNVRGKGYRFGKEKMKV